MSITLSGGISAEEASRRFLTLKAPATLKAALSKEASPQTEKPSFCLIGKASPSLVLEARKAVLNYKLNILESTGRLFLETPKDILKDLNLSPTEYTSLRSVTQKLMQLAAKARE